MRNILLLIVILAFFASIAISTNSTALAVGLEGREFFQRKCNACHEVTVPKEDESLLSRMDRKGPSLRYAGSKFKKGFIKRWLQDPKPIRPLVYSSLTKANPGKHLRLSPEDSALVASYLEGLKANSFKVTGLSPKDNLLGKQIFSQRYTCYGCHRVRSKSSITGGLSGPSLVGAARRLNPDWIYAFLSNPRAFSPVGAMPVYAGLIKEKDLKALSKYIASFE